MNTHFSTQEWAPFLSVSVNSPFNPCRSPEKCEELELISNCKLILKQEQQGVAYEDLNSREETGEEI